MHLQTPSATLCLSRRRTSAPRSAAVGDHASLPSFSLVELVIVVVIIGVIAAIAVPRISAGVLRTDESALVADLTALRNAIDRYAAEHQGVFPGAVADGIGGGANSETAFLNHLLYYSNIQGQVSTTPDPSYRPGPYLRKMPPVPVGPNKNSTSVAVDVANSPPVVTAGTTCWVYNPSTGEIIADTDDANRDNTRAYDEY